MKFKYFPGQAGYKYTYVANTSHAHTVTRAVDFALMSDTFTDSRWYEERMREEFARLPKVSP